MSWINAGIAVAGVATSAYGAYNQKKNAKDAAKAGTPVPYNTQGPYGNSYIDPVTHTATYNPAANPFTNLLSSGGTAALANAFTAPGSFLSGADSELAAAYQGLLPSGLESATQERYGLLNQLAQPAEQRAGNKLQDQLFARGQTGTTGGGIQQEAFQNSLNQADLQRQLSAQDWAQTRANNRFSSALQAVGSGQQGQVNNWNIGSGALGGFQNILGGIYGAAGQAQGINSATPAQLAAWSGSQVSPWVSGAAGLLNSGVIQGIAGQYFNPGPTSSYTPPTSTVPQPTGSSTNPYGLNFGMTGSIAPQMPQMGYGSSTFPGVQ